MQKTGNRDVDRSLEKMSQLMERLEADPNLLKDPSSLRHIQEAMLDCGSQLGSGAAQVVANGLVPAQGQPSTAISLIDPAIGASHSTGALISAIVKQGAKAAVSRKIIGLVKKSLQRTLGAAYPHALVAMIGPDMEDLLLCAGVHYLASNVEIPMRERVQEGARLALTTIGSDCTAKAISGVVEALTPAFEEIAGLIQSTEQNELLDPKPFDEAQKA